MAPKIVFGTLKDAMSAQYLHDRGVSHVTSLVATQVKARLAARVRLATGSTVAVKERVDLLSRKAVKERETELRAAVADVVEHLRDREVVFIHCHSGLLRTPLVAIAALKELGLSNQQALKLVTAAQEFRGANLKAFNGNQNLRELVRRLWFPELSLEQFVLGSQSENARNPRGTNKRARRNEP